MKAVSWESKKNIKIKDAPDPHVVNPRDAVIKVSLTAICGSDLHLYDGYVPSMKKGDIMGHEFMGEVVELGERVHNIDLGERVVIPASISCGNCFYCQNAMWSLCDNSNPNAGLAEDMYGFSGAGLFGYSHMFGGYAGGQAEYVRVPFADVGALKIEDDSLSDEDVLFLGDILPTGYMAAENCNIQPGDIVAVWGAGPVGQFAIMSARLLGAHQVIAIDRFPERLKMAEEIGGALPINYEETHDLIETLKDLTGGRGPDSCIDAVGMEAHGLGLSAILDRAKQATKLATDRLTGLRQAIQACRKGGTVSIPGVYGGFLDKVPFGAAFQKGLTFKSGQTHVHHYMDFLLERIMQGDIHPSKIITHRMSLEKAPTGYEIFKNKEDECIKVVLKP